MFNVFPSPQGLLTFFLLLENDDRGRSFWNPTKTRRHIEIWIRRCGGGGGGGISPHTQRLIILLLLYWMRNFTVDIASYEKEEEYKKRISQNITEFHFLVTKRPLIRKGEKKSQFCHLNLFTGRTGLYSLVSLYMAKPTPFALNIFLISILGRFRWYPPDLQELLHRCVQWPHNYIIYDVRMGVFVQLWKNLK